MQGKHGLRCCSPIAPGTQFHRSMLEACHVGFLLTPRTSSREMDLEKKLSSHCRTWFHFGTSAGKVHPLFPFTSLICFVPVFRTARPGSGMHTVKV
jgi:hypothetical protein